MPAKGRSAQRSSWASQRASHTSEACQEVVHLTTVDLQGDRRPEEIHAEELTKLPCDARDGICCVEV